MDKPDEDLKYQMSIVNFASRGSISLKDMQDSALHIYPLESVQNISAKLNFYSRQLSPAGSKDRLDSERPKVFPKIASHSKKNMTKEVTLKNPEHSALKFLAKINPSTSPTLKHRKLFESLVPVKKRAHIGSHNLEDSLAQGSTSRRTFDEELRMYNSVKDLSSSKEAYDLKLRAFGGPKSSKKHVNLNDLAMSKIDYRQPMMAYSIANSRRSSRGLGLPVVGAYSVKTKPIVSITPKKIGPSYASLNTSKVEIFRSRKERSLYQTASSPIVTKRGSGQTSESKKPATSEELLDKINYFFTWDSKRNKNLRLEDLERVNVTASGLIEKGKLLCLLLTLKNPEEIRDDTDSSFIVENYGKATQSVLAMRFKKEEENNLMIIDTLAEELAYLITAKNNFSNPE